MKGEILAERAHFLLFHTTNLNSFYSVLYCRNLNEVNSFFESTEEGGWEDLSAAGCEWSFTYLRCWYSWFILCSHLVDCLVDLLSNAFRTSSTKAPDALPSVKKWKAFAKEIELLKRALSKKDSEKVLTAYKNAEETLDAYLDAVELPSGIELKQMWKVQSSWSFEYISLYAERNYIMDLQKLRRGWFVLLNASSCGYEIALVWICIETSNLSPFL